MHLYIKRYDFNEDSTAGLLFVRGQFECHTLEDQEREIKFPGETAIPRGNYMVELRTVGGFHQRYLDRYGPGFHKGMLHVKDVPDFKYILFHTGNTDEHTEGCILVGNTMQNAAGTNMIPPGKTRVAYKQFYPKVRDAILGGEKVFLHIDRLRV